MCYGFGFAGYYAGQSSLSNNGLAWSAAVLDFFAVFLFHSGHGSAFNVKLVGNQLQDAVWTRFDAFVAAIALVCVNYNEVVA